MRKIYIFVVLMSLMGCKGGDENKEEESIDIQEEAIVDVDTMSLRLQTFQKQLLCNGKLGAVQRADLMCPNQGTMLEKVLVVNGQRVSKGAVLAIADMHEKSQALDRAKHDLERSKVELQDKLIGLGYDGNLNNVPADVLKRMEITSGYYSAKFSLESAKKALADCKLIAPFSGRIANLEAHAFQNGSKFCTLIDDSSFDVEFKILEAELSFVSKGQKVKISPFVNKDNEYEGVVEEINPTIDDKGLVKIKARMKNSSAKLIDGMNVRVIVESAVPKMYVVPKEAVVERDGYHVVFMYDKKTQRAVWTYVDIMYSNLNEYAITGCERKETEIHEGDIVITSGNQNLADDTQVRASETEER